MKVLLDTNIFLDFLLLREKEQAAKDILEFNKNDNFKFFVADISLINIDYIAKKEVANIREFLKYINDNFTVLGADNISFKNALNIENRDLEDNLQYCLALQQGCDCIVTNDKTFLKKDVNVIGSEDFVAKYLN